MNNPIDCVNDTTLITLHSKSPQQHNRLYYWWVCHLRAFLFACGEIVRNPFSNVMTLLVIGIAFSLPVIFFTLLQNAQSAAVNWHASPKITLYLKQGLSTAQINQMLQELNQNTEIEQAHYISAEEGMQSLQNSGSVNPDALQSLGSNPLPAVIEVTPNHINSSPQRIQQLYAQLQTLNAVDLAQLNLDWVKRLYYVLEALKYLTLAIATLFAGGLVLIVGNTMRLDMKSNQEEIDILRLIGATKSFIRRPLLYRGTLYGSIGALLAWVLYSIFLEWMQTPVSHLAMSYDTTMTLRGLSMLQGLAVIVIGGLLSYIGTRVVVNQYLRKERTLV